MAKLERTINGNFDELLTRITDGVLNGSVSATLEDLTDFRAESARCSVRVFERYSFTGENRLSLTVTMFQTENNEIRLSAITSGGSQGLFLKWNTIGEEAFLEKFKETLDCL